MTTETRAQRPAGLDERLARWQFDPHPRLANAHLQTIAGALWRRRVHPALADAEARLVRTEPDVELLARVNWAGDDAGPTVLLVHGLEGSDESGYMLGAAGKALDAGWHVARLNVRNCGGTEHLAPTLYHSGMSTDVARVVEHLAAERRVSSLVAIGFSLGGNMVLRMAGEFGDAAPEKLVAVATVSPAADLAASATALERRSNLLYQKRFVRSLARRMRRKDELFPGRFDVSRLAKMRTVRDYDDLYIAPLYGFRDADDYYERASCVPLIPKIRVPALLLHSLDDPFIPLTDRVRRACEENELVSLVATRRGGHVGFVSAHPSDRHWAESRALEFARVAIDGPAGAPPGREARG